MESIYCTTVMGFGMTFLKTSSLKPFGKSMEKVQVVLSEQHKTHKEWQIGPIVNMQLWHWWWTYRGWLRKKPCQKKYAQRRDTWVDQKWCYGSWVLVPYNVWMHWSNGSWQSPCRCLDQYSYWCHSSHKCQHHRFSHSWPGATLNIWVFIACRFL